LAVVFFNKCFFSQLLKFIFQFWRHEFDKPLGLWLRDVASGNGIVRLQGGGFVVVEMWRVSKRWF
jgi:hypothetical protein